MHFEIIGDIEDIQTIASGRTIRERRRLRRAYGGRRWRKCKGVATVRLTNATLVRAEVHWYEAHGIGRKEAKIKRILGRLTP